MLLLHCVKCHHISLLIVINHEKLFENVEACGNVKQKIQRERERERERVHAGETERAELNFKIISRLCTYNALIGAIYTSPHGTVISTSYFNAHTSI